MCAGEVSFGAHIQVIVMLVVQYGIQSCNTGNTDRAGGESYIQVGVIGTFLLEASAMVSGRVSTLI